MDGDGCAANRAEWDGETQPQVAFSMDINMGMVTGWSRCRRG